MQRKDVAWEMGDSLPGTLADVRRSVGGEWVDSRQCSNKGSMVGQMQPIIIELTWLISQ